MFVFLTCSSVDGAKLSFDFVGDGGGALEEGEHKSRHRDDDKKRARDDGCMRCADYLADLQDHCTRDHFESLYVAQQAVVRSWFETHYTRTPSYDGAKGAVVVYDTFFRVRYMQRLFQC